MKGGMDAFFTNVAVSDEEIYAMFKLQLWTYIKDNRDVSTFDVKEYLMQYRHRPAANRSEYTYSLSAIKNLYILNRLESDNFITSHKKGVEKIYRVNFAVHAIFN